MKSSILYKAAVVKEDIMGLNLRLGQENLEKAIMVEVINLSVHFALGKKNPAI